MPSRSSGSCRKPVTPCSMTSGRPPTFDATTGTSHAIASSAARPKLSCSDGKRTRRMLRAMESRPPARRASRRRKPHPTRGRACMRCPTPDRLPRAAAAPAQLGDAGKHLHDGVDPLYRPKVRHMDDELRRGSGANRWRRPDVSTAIDIAIEAIGNHLNRPLHLQFTASRVAQTLRYRRDAVRGFDRVGHNFRKRRVTANERDVCPMQRRDHSRHAWWLASSTCRARIAAVACGIA